MPAFKFKMNGGRSELIREMSGGTGERIKRYYSGICQFVKLAKSFDASLVLRASEVLPKCDVLAGVAIGSRRRRGCDVDLRWEGRGDAADTTRISRGWVATPPRPRRRRAGLLARRRKTRG